MRLLSTLALAGPNVWSKAPVLEARVQLAEWAQLSASAIPEFQQQLRAWLPRLVLRSGADDPAGGTPAEGTALRCVAQAMLDVTLAVQALSRGPVEFGQVIETDEAHTHLLVVECEEAALTRACLEFAGELCLAAIRHELPDVVAGLQRLRDVADDVCLDVTTGALVAVARQRGIPVRRLDPVALVQLGHGARQHRILSNITDQTSTIAEFISLDKDLTKAVLRQVGVPFPEGRPVADREDAWRAACELGLPVVVKPRDGDYQLGVGLNLRTREDIVAAYDEARRHRDEVLVERFASGAQYRVTVVGERVAAAIRRVSPQVTGDGVQTVTELIDEANQRDPRRGDDDAAPLNKIRPDDDTPLFLAEQGLTLDAIPPAGAEVILSRLAHACAGGEVRDVTDELHPDVAAVCIRAAQVLGIDLAGLDLVAEDIRRPLEEQGGVVLEVNVGPAIALHFPPFCDRPQPICEIILEHLFPPGQSGRIPVAVVSGEGDNSRVARWLETLLRRPGQRIGRSSSEGLYVGGRRIKAGDAANLAGARGLLLCPDVDLAILEQAFDKIRTEGLEMDRCDVVILAGPDTGVVPGTIVPQEIARVAQVLIESLGPQGVLVVDVEQAALLAQAVSLPAQLIVVAPSPEFLAIHPLPAAASVRYVFGREGDIVLRSGALGEQVLVLDPQWFSHIPPATARGRDLLRAVAAAWAWLVPLDQLRARLAALLHMHQV
ncbi:MAG: cyanophycin synthetase [Planctomycetota bacterium]|nr:cyanophycin synthetase [Planctomycetota bacterium]